MRADTISHMLARVISYCFQNTAQSSEAWETLFMEADQWRASLPSGFEPSSKAIASDGVFPSLRLMNPGTVSIYQLE